MAQAFPANNESDKAMRPKADLTTREITILDLLTSGITTSAAIGQRLGVSERFVTNAISGLLGKMDARNRTQLAVKWWARKNEGQ